MWDQIIIGAVTAAFACGGAWAGTQIRVKSLEQRLGHVERKIDIISNRTVQLIKAHNTNHADSIDANKIDI